MFGSQVFNKSFGYVDLESSNAVLLYGVRFITLSLYLTTTTFISLDALLKSPTPFFLFSNVCSDTSDGTSWILVCWKCIVEKYYIQSINIIAIICVHKNQVV